MHMKHHKENLYLVISSKLTLPELGDDVEDSPPDSSCPRLPMLPVRLILRGWEGKETGGRRQELAKEEGGRGSLGRKGKGGKEGKGNLWPAFPSAGEFMLWSAVSLLWSPSGGVGVHRDILGRRGCHGGD